MIRLIFFLIKPFHTTDAIVIYYWEDLGHIKILRREKFILLKQTF